MSDFQVPRKEFVDDVPTQHGHMLCDGFMGEERPFRRRKRTRQSQKNSESSALHAPKLELVKGGPPRIALEPSALQICSTVLDRAEVDEVEDDDDDLVFRFHSAPSATSPEQRRDFRSVKKISDRRRRHYKASMVEVMAQLENLRGPICPTHGSDSEDDNDEMIVDMNDHEEECADDIEEVPEQQANDPDEIQDELDSPRSRQRRHIEHAPRESLLQIPASSDNDLSHPGQFSRVQWDGPRTDVVDDDVIEESSQISRLRHQRQTKLPSQRKYLTDLLRTLNKRLQGTL